jgi:eukaryotic-like serine/threonine-protein kinase
VQVLADRLNDLTGALATTDRLIELYPERAPARAARGVILARLGRAKEAGAEIDRARQLSEDAVVLYQAACVSALTGETAEAIDLLRKALRTGFTDLAGMDADADLNALRELAEYKKLRDSAGTLFR